MYQVLLFGHLIGVGLLVLGTGIYLAGTEGLRRARTREQATACVAVAQGGTRVLAPGGLILLGFGLTLAARSWSFTEPWIITSLALVLVLGINGLRSERWLVHVRQGVSSAGTHVPAIVRAPAHHAANRATLIVLAELEFLMTVKPPTVTLATSLLVVTATAAILAIATTWAQRYRPAGLGDDALRGRSRD